MLSDLVDDGYFEVQTDFFVTQFKVKKVINEQDYIIRESERVEYTSPKLYENKVGA